LADIATELLRQAGHGELKFVPWPDDHARIDIGSFAGDFTKAREHLGWEPQVSFVDAVADVLAHFAGSEATTS
jgi:nucleoside-diphosphate-sugar epimerase